MAYSELIKNFSKIRDYMREFYVYGFKSRDDFQKKSARSYDDERRRVESWLGEYMQFRQNAEGKNVFLSIDSRDLHTNPLYKAWKAKSFTDGDIILYFLLFDILYTTEDVKSLSEIMLEIDERLSVFENPRMFDESTVRKKLKEYTAAGMLHSEKQGRNVFYRRANTVSLENLDGVTFFTEAAPCGVIGSYILDQEEPQKQKIAFKHHYITSALDSEILGMLFEAIEERKSVTVEIQNRKRQVHVYNGVVPLKIFISVQTGRQYLMGYSYRSNRIRCYRLDYILSVKKETVCENYEKLRANLERMQAHMWGVSAQNKSHTRMETVTFTVQYGKKEQHIHERLEREKRCGCVVRIDENTSRFYAEVFDSSELIPWIRTFICRITEIHFSNAKLEEQFQEDLNKMYEMYHLEDL